MRRRIKVCSILKNYPLGTIKNKILIRVKVIINIAIKILVILLAITWLIIQGYLIFYKD